MSRYLQKSQKKIGHPLWTFPHPPQTFFEIPPCAKHVIFISEFDNFGKNPPLYDIKNISEISACAWRNFQFIFLDHFSSPIRPKMVEFHSHSILTG